MHALIHSDKKITYTCSVALLQNFHHNEFLQFQQTLITGVARYIKPKKAGFRAIAVEPEDSPVLSGGAPGPHRIQGIGPGFVPDVLETSILDGVVKVSNDSAVSMARRLAAEEGLLVGISAGANVQAAIDYGSRPDNKGKTIVTILCDFGERYIQTVLFDALRYEGSDSID